MPPLASAVLLLALGTPAAIGPTGPPIESGLEERVDVQFVLLDAVVIDRRGRTRPDLDKVDFELFVDGDEVEIASLDLHCPGGGSRDVEADWRPGRAPAPEPRDHDGPGRRMVLVFDYFHMNPARSFEAALAALERFGAEGDEHMIVALGSSLRVELGFTGDLGRVKQTLERMSRDPGLFAANHAHLTEWRFFDRVERLFDVLEPLPGRKILVLFSGANAPDGFYHDRAFERLAARSAIARTALYPVDTDGLGLGPLGGPEQLRRLAIETGGRMTADTNDLTLAYGRAHRDLACSYTLGFEDRAPKLDRARRLSVYARRKQAGLRVLHPAFYVVRSRERKRESLARTAELAPESFDDVGLLAELVPLEPGPGGRKWRARLSIEVAPQLIAGATPETSFTLRAFVRKPNGTALHSWEWEIPGERTARRAADGAVTVEETIAARPGGYRVSAVLLGPGAVEPLATFEDVELPAIPAAAGTETAP